MTEEPIKRGDTWWRRRHAGGWETRRDSEEVWRIAKGPPPPPPAPSGPPAAIIGTARVGSGQPSDNGGKRRGARNVLIVVAGVWAVGVVLWMGARDWLFDSGSGSSVGTATLVACGAQPPPAPRPLQYERPPEPMLDPKVDYWAIIRTSCGDMQVDLLEDKAPTAVNNFVFLAQAGFYDGLIWHHVTPDFIIQSGDPNGVNASPPDGPGYMIKDELPSNSDAYVFGKVGFANAGKPHSAGSQFFIVVHDLAGALSGSPSPLSIEPTYTIFGRVPKRFFGSIQEIAQQPTIGGTDPLVSVRPRLPIYLNSVEILARD